jgi:antitoxin (DNA-binding transcriptional repressor) of toxin-antitoxin stability system
MTANEAARHFAAVLGRVAAGEEIEVVRNGAPVAVIAPPPSSVPTKRSHERFASAPTRDDSFAEDLRALQAELRAPPDAWGS